MMLCDKTKTEKTKDIRDYTFSFLDSLPSYKYITVYIPDSHRPSPIQSKCSKVPYPTNTIFLQHTIAQPEEKRKTLTCKPAPPLSRLANSISAPSPRVSLVRARARAARPNEQSLIQFALSRARARGNGTAAHLRASLASLALKTRENARCTFRIPDTYPSSQRGSVISRSRARRAISYSTRVAPGAGSKRARESAVAMIYRRVLVIVRLDARAIRVSFSISRAREVIAVRKLFNAPAAWANSAR